MNERSQAGLATGSRARSQENELQRALAVLRRRALAILLIAITVAGAAVGLSLLQDERYTASASILFRAQSLAQELPGSTSPAVDAQTQAATNLELVSLDRVAVRTAQRLRPGFEPLEVSGNVDVSAKGASNVVDVKAEWGSPRFAALMATTFAQQFVHFQADAERSRIRAAQRRLRLALAREHGSASPNQSRIDTMTAKLDDLEVLKSVSSGQAQVIQPADVPTSRSSPKPVRNGLIGLFAGLLLGIGLAIALEQLDRRVRSPSELEELLEVPLLAQIPESDNVVAAASSPLPEPPLEAEFFNVLCTTVQRLDHGGGVRSLLVTSPTAELGKTTVALNLALASARSGARTLFLEVDLRRPIVAQRLGLESERSLVEALSSELALSDVVQTIPLPSPDSANGGEPELDIVVAGEQNRDAHRLIESGEMERLMDEAEAGYDLVVVDAPPAGLISDAVALLSIVEAAVIVCRLGRTTREQALLLRSQLEQIDANVLGVVANFAPVKVDQYYGAYRWQVSQETARALARSRRKAKDRVA